MILHYHNTPIYYTAKGKGEALLFLHGFLESATMWLKLESHFLKTHQVICVDLPGFGKSGNLAKIHSMELMGDVVIQLLNTLKISEITCVGHSMGGYVALAMAEKKPDLIKNLILLNSTTYKDNDLRKENRDRAIKFMKSQQKTIVSMSISNLFTEAERSTFKNEIENLKEDAFQFSAEGIVAAIKGMRDRKDRTKVLENFKNKKAIVFGNKDTIVSSKDSVEISKITTSKLFEVNSGHMSWLTNYDETVKVLTLIV